jgi:hypothetical protein
LAAGPADEQHGVDHLAPADRGRRAASTGRVEQVGDELPLLVGERGGLMPGSLPAARDSSAVVKRAFRTGSIGYRP